jgi:hypothetical protein
MLLTFRLYQHIRTRLEDILPLRMSIDVWKFPQRLYDFNKSVLRNVVGWKVFAGIDKDILNPIPETIDVVFSLEGSRYFYRYFVSRF